MSFLTRIPIWLRVVLLVDVLVGASALAIGYLAADVAGGVIEDHLFNELVRNTGRFLGEQRLPINDTMMGYLGRMYGLEVLAVDSRTGRALGSSLSPAKRDELRAAMSAPGVSRVWVGGESYRMSPYDLPGGDPSREARGPVRLYLLVGDQRLAAARGRAVERIQGVALWVLAAATALAAVLAGTIARPIRRLGAYVDQFGRSEEPGALSARRADLAGLAEGPAEVARLARSFGEMLSRLDDAQGRLDRSGRLATLGRIAASVAHEIRNPLSGIKMNLRVLEDDLADGTCDPQALDRIGREIDRMDVYLQELMELAGGARPSAPAEPERADLPAVVESVLGLLAGRCRHEGVQVCREFALSPAAAAPAGRVRQVVLNLLVNALDAMGGGGRIVVTLTTAGGMVRLAVADQGGGVRADGEDIFSPFVSTKPGGAGLGLHVCRQIVEAHGGRIGYDSSAGGATFWFELPAVGETASDAPCTRDHTEVTPP